ncbi:MAG: hypothetical protein J6M58_09440 [Clostridium sp.]|nr:hypothetical protein [Clostridium sp.]MBP3216431.1 hypothetical protein [Clostridium sp.]
MRRRNCMAAVLAAFLWMILFALSGCSGKKEPAAGAQTAPESASETAAETVEAVKEMETAAPEDTHAARSPRKAVDMSKVPAVKNPDGSFTIFVYMVGSDLESYGQAASHDIEEMCLAKTGEKVKIVLITGGAEEWGHASVKAGTTQIFTIEDGELTELADLGLQNMANEGTLESFLTWAGKNCISDRNALILWNHGGGTLMGYGLDENYPDDILELCDIGDALRASGMHFDFVGFDACLMCTVETAKMLSPYADYMIASEETEPSSGWFYTEWLNALAENPGMAVEDLGRLIVDDFVPVEEERSDYETYTLALIDLSQIQPVLDAMQEFFENERGLMKIDYKSLARARSNTKAFGNGMFEQIDLLDFVVNNRTDSAGGNKVKRAVDKAVIYQKNTTGHAGGLAFYFPFSNPDAYQKVSENLLNAGFTGEWFHLYNDFMNTLIKGQEQTVEKDASTLETKKSMERFRQYPWYDMSWDMVGEDTLLDAHALQLELDGEGYPALHFTETQRDLLTDMMQWYFVWDKETMSMTGLGYYKRNTPQSDYYACEAHPWPTINGTAVSYFELYNDPEYEYGLVPCLRNGDEFICLVIEYRGAILRPGAEWNLLGFVHMDTEEISLSEGIRFEMAKKGALPLQQGDTIQFIRYEMGALDTELKEGENGEKYSSFGEPLTYDGTWDIRAEDLFLASGVKPGQGRILTWYLIRDIYQNIHRSGVLFWIREEDGEWGYQY